LCSNPSLAYARVYQNRKKVGAYPVCVGHGLWLLGFQAFSQDVLRSNLADLASVFGLGKGVIPRVEVSLTP